MMIAFSFVAQNGLIFVTKKAEARNCGKNVVYLLPKEWSMQKTSDIFPHIVPKEVDVAICRSSDLHFSKI